MGMVLVALEKSPFAEDTMVLITTDHGVPFPLNKATLQDRGTGVLFMLRVPKQKGKKRSQALVSQLDFFPTVCEAAKLEKPAWLEGESLLPVLKGEDTQRQALLTTTNHHVEYEPSRSIRTRAHHLIRRFVSGPRSAPNVDSTRLKAFVEKDGFFDHDADEFELYDLINDPEELENLAGNGACEVLLESLSAQLRDLMKASSDPLLEEIPQEAALR
jgi:arylsulfatase A-like enzyme